MIQRRTLGTLLRVVVSLLLIVALIVGSDWSQVARLAARAEPVWLVVSVAMSPLLALVSAWKWAVLLRARGGPLSLGRLFELYLVGYFFNNILPSNVGGDVVRAYQAGRELDDHATALASVFVERFTGLTVLVALAIGALALRGDLFPDPRFTLALGFVLAAYAAVVVVVWLLPGRPLAASIATRFAGRLVGHALRLQAAIHDYAGHRRALAGAMALSIVFYALAMVNVHVSALAFGVRLSPMTLVAIVPVILLIAMLPISLGGIGVHEWAYVYTFTAVGAGGPAGLLVALLMRVKSLLFGVIGGLLHARGQRRVTAPPSATPQGSRGARSP